MNRNWNSFSKEKLLTLIQTTPSFFPDEKYYIMNDISEWKVSLEKMKKMYALLFEEKKEIKNKIENYQDGCISALKNFEKRKYEKIDLKKIKKKIANISYKSRMLKLHTSEKKYDADYSPEDILLKL